MTSGDGHATAVGRDPGTAWSREHSTAVHEAGHAVMAYLLGRRFASITVVEDEESYGRVTSAAIGSWFRPDIEIDGRTRRLIEDRVMILLAGGETERAWCERVAGTPDDWEGRVDAGAAGDVQRAVSIADHMCGGSVPELEAYLEWLRQRVLGFTGRGPGFRGW